MFYVVLFKSVLMKVRSEGGWGVREWFVDASIHPTDPVGHIGVVSPTKKYSLSFRHPFTTHHGEIGTIDFMELLAVYEALLRLHEDVTQDATKYLEGTVIINTDSRLALHLIDQWLRNSGIYRVHVEGHAPPFAGEYTAEELVSKLDEITDGKTSKLLSLIVETVRDILSAVNRNETWLFLRYIHTGRNPAHKVIVRSGSKPSID